MLPSFTLVSSLATSRLRVGEMMYSHLPGGLIRLAIAGFLSVGDRIILITAGERIHQGIMCYSHSTITDDSYLGSVRYVHGGITFVELFMKTRGDVCNVVTSERQEKHCFPGPVIKLPSETPMSALLHGRHQQPQIVTLEEKQFPGVHGSCLCFRAPVPVNGILGSLVTSTQAGVGGSRLLDVYGAVYTTKDLDGVPYALVGNMQEAIEGLQTLEEYRGRKVSLVTPIMQANT